MLCILSMELWFCLMCDWNQNMCRGGDFHHRIRLLPSPLSTYRLQQFLRQADMVLDTFPIGMSFHTVAMALSVGTPGESTSHELV